MNKALGWIGCIGGILGAFTVAIGNLIGYVPFLIGATAYCIVAAKQKDIPLLLLNIVFACANVIGLIRWILQ